MAALPTFNAGTEPTAGQLQTLLPIKAIKGSDQTVNNSATLVNDSALFASVAANAIYRFEMHLRYSTNTTANLKLAYTFPAGLTMKNDLIGKGSGTSVLDIFAGDQTAQWLISGNGAASRLTGTITVSSTPGTWQLQWAQQTANVSNTIVQAGSYLLLTQIG